MEKLKFEFVTTKSAIDEYLQKVENYTGTRLPLSYALKAKIVGVYLDRYLVAGYMIVTKPPFRSYIFVPDKLRKAHPFFKNNSYEMMEVNGLWISPAVKSPKAQFQIWLRLVRDIFLSKKQYLLLLSDKRNRTIQKIHQLTNPTSLYEGVPQLLPGENTHESIRVGFTTRWNIVLNLPKYYFEFRKRERRASEALRQKSYGGSGRLEDKHASVS